MCAVENAEDAPFRAARAIRKAVAALDARKDVIAVHRVAHCVATDEQVAVHVFTRRIGHDEAVTVAMRDQTPGQLIHLRTWPRGRFSLGLSAVPLRQTLSL